MRRAKPVGQAVAPHRIEFQGLLEPLALFGDKLFHKHGTNTVVAVAFVAMDRVLDEGAPEIGKERLQRGKGHGHNDTVGGFRVFVSRTRLGLIKWHKGVKAPVHLLPLGFGTVRYALGILAQIENLAENCVMEFTSGLPWQITRVAVLVLLPINGSIFGGLVSAWHIAVVHTRLHAPSRKRSVISSQSMESSKTFEGCWPSIVALASKQRPLRSNIVGT